MCKPSEAAWSWFYVFTGCIMVMLSSHWNIPIDIDAGIIGAGLQAFTTVNKHAD